MLPLNRLFIAIMFVFCVVHLSQAQSPFLEPNKYWIYQSYNTNDVPQSIGASALTIGKDTVVNAIEYKQIIEFQLDGSHNCQFPPCFEPHYPYELISNGIPIALMREDQEEGKLYVISEEHCSNGEENLMYDFDLMIGDSIINCLRESMVLIDEQDRGIVEEYGVENLFNQDRQIQYTTGLVDPLGLAFWDTVRIIQGIGHEWLGILGDSSSKLIDVCYVANCDILSSTKEPIDHQLIHIYPNPTSDKLMISDELSNNGYAFRIFSSFGIEISAGTSSGNSIDVSLLPEGYYFGEILLDSQLYFTFIKY